MTASLVLALAGCATPAKWRNHADYKIGEGSKQILALVRVTADNVQLDDCSACFGIKRAFKVNCARIDSTGVVYQPIDRDMAFLTEVECRREDRTIVRHKFEFPYYASATEEKEAIHYLGNIELIFLGDRAPLVHISENATRVREIMREHGRDTHKLPILQSTLRKQDNVWDQERRVRY